MTRQKGVDTKIQVTRGFVTEFTPLAFPQEAAIDIDNCIIDTDGSARRRPGLDLEVGFQLQPVGGVSLTATQVADIAFTTYLWESVGGSGAVSIIVQQVGNVLQFYAQSGAASANKVGEVDLGQFTVDSAKMHQVNMEFTSGLGDLFVVSKYMEPIRVSLDGTTFTVEPITLQIRDFDGVDDGLGVTARHVFLSKEHQYNLRNQGWTTRNIAEFAGYSSLSAALAAADSDEPFTGTSFPSNADIMTVGIVVNGGGNLDFDPEFIREDFLGNTPAPKGHYILDAFNKDRRNATLLLGGELDIDTVSVATRPEAVAFLQGRIFYVSPVDDEQISGIFYSQQLVEKSKAALCFQEADPTASEINDLVATDGGFLPTPGVGQIFKIQEMGNGIVCLASNGVWYLSGGEVGVSFSATSLRLEKIHSAGALGTSSAVAAGGKLYFWGVEGIMVVSLDDRGTAFVENLTQSSIQSFYVDISAASRLEAKAVYIPEQRKIFWGYKDAAVDAAPTVGGINRMLVLALDVKGFYKYSIGADDDNNYPRVVGLSRISPIAIAVEEHNVTDSDGVVVTDSSLVPVTHMDDSNTGQAATLKLATMAYDTGSSNFMFTFSTFHDRGFVDWTSQPLGSLPMDSFIEYAEFAMGAIHTKGMPTHIYSHYATVSKNLEVGGYYELPPL